MRFVSNNLSAVTGAALIIGSLAFPAHAAPILNPLNGHYYDSVQSNGISWFAANAAAAAMSFGGMQGHLVTITSAGEQNFITANLPQALGTPSSFGFWTGGLRTVSSTSPFAYTWVTAETFSYTNFLPGEPNGDAPPAGIHFFGLGSAAGGWNDAPAFFTAINGFVVEFESPVPAPGALALIGLGLIGLWASRRRHN